MDRILIIVFLLAVLPYLGIPNRYDVWIVFLLVILLAHALYLFTKRHNIFSNTEASVEKTTIEKVKDSKEEKTA